MATGRQRLAANQAELETQAREDAELQAATARARDAGGATGLSTLLGSSDGLSASAGVPEALATTAVATALMGPLGLLVGGAQWLFTREEEKNTLDRIAAENEVLGNSANVVYQRIDELTRSAPTEADREILGNIRAELDAGMTGAGSGSAAIRAKGGEAIQNALGRLNDYSIANEEQQIAQQAADDIARRQMGDTLFSRAEGLRKEYETVSQPFLARQQSITGLYDALARNNPIDAVAASRQIARVFEPSGPLTEEDVRAYSGAGSLVDKLKGIVGDWTEGQPLTDEMRNDLAELGGALWEIEKGAQERRDVRYQGLLEDAGSPENPVPDKYRDNFSYSQQLPDPIWRPVGIGPQSPSDPVRPPARPRRGSGARIESAAPSAVPQGPAGRTLTRRDRQEAAAAERERQRAESRANASGQIVFPTN